MKVGTETGSVINAIYASSGQLEPKVGMGATMILWTDRRAATIVKVTPTQVHVQRDRAARADRNGMSDAQSYTYTPDPDGEVVVFRKTKNGYRNKGGAGLLIGARREYYDFSF